MRRLALFVSLFGLLLFGACSEDSPTVETGDDAAGEDAADAPEVHKVAVEAEDYGYVMPKTVEAGTIEFTMENTGKELHIAALAKVKDGKTMADAAKDLQSATPPADPASENIGGIASTSPGLEGNVTAELDAGTYFFACFIPSADGLPHVAKGMVQEFEVTEAKGEIAEAPEPGGKIVAEDFLYTTEYKVKAGQQVVEFTNEGTQGHEITLLEFAAGKGPADLQAFFEKPGPDLPATFYGGPVTKPGETVSWRMPAMVRGKSYFFMCLIPDDADGVPHAVKGMVLPVAVT